MTGEPILPGLLYSIWGAGSVLTKCYLLQNGAPETQHMFCFSCTSFSTCVHLLQFIVEKGYLFFKNWVQNCHSKGEVYNRIFHLSALPDTVLRN